MLKNKCQDAINPPSLPWMMNCSKTAASFFPPRRGTALAPGRAAEINLRRQGCNMRSMKFCQGSLSAVGRKPSHSQTPSLWENKQKNPNDSKKNLTAFTLHQTSPAQHGTGPSSCPAHGVMLPLCHSTSQPSAFSPLPHRH